MHQVDISQATNSPETLFQTVLDGNEVVITQEQSADFKNSSCKSTKKTTAIGKCQRADLDV